MLVCACYTFIIPFLERVHIILANVMGTEMPKATAEKEKFQFGLPRFKPNILATSPC